MAQVLSSLIFVPNFIKQVGLAKRPPSKGPFGATLLSPRRCPRCQVDWSLQRVPAERSFGRSFRFGGGKFGAKVREGANREKLTVKKIINNEMFFFVFFFSPFMSLINREKLCVNREKNWHQKSTIFSPLVLHRLRLLEKFFAKFAAKFFTKFSALFCWDMQSKKKLQP